MDSQIQGGNSGIFGGLTSYIDGNGSYVVGNNNSIGGNSENVFILGNNVHIGGTMTADGVIAGDNVSGAVALGNNTSVSVAGGVALGEGSGATVGASAIGYDPATGLASTATTGIWKSTNAAVSIGKVDGTITRQLVGLAAGTADSDAVNVAQLKAVEGKIATTIATVSNRYFSVNGTDQGIDSNYANDGAKTEGSIAIGEKAKAGGTISDRLAVAMGYNAQALGSSSLALGPWAYTEGASSVALGDGTKIYIGTPYSIAFGYKAQAGNPGASANSDTMVAIGANSWAKGGHSVALGRFAYAVGPSAISIGDEAGVAVTGAPQPGEDPDRYAKGISIGQRAQTVEEAVALGVGAGGLARGGIAVGETAGAWGSCGVAVGVDAVARDDYAIASGLTAFANAPFSMALGSRSTSGITRAEWNAMSMTDTQRFGEATAIPVGQPNAGMIQYTQPKYTMAIGPFAGAKGHAALSLGANADAVESYALALGASTTATPSGSIALGAGSVASTKEGVAGYDPLTKATSTKTDLVWRSTAAALSIGDNSAGKMSRQIVNLAAGAADSDAVNVAQLKAGIAAASAPWTLKTTSGGATTAGYGIGPDGVVTLVAGNNVTLTQADGTVTINATGGGSGDSGVHYYSVNSTENATGSNYLNDGAHGTDSLAAGVGARTYETNGLAVGRLALSTGTNGTAVGFSAMAASSDTVSVGRNTMARGDRAVAVGSDLDAVGKKTIVIGSNLNNKDRGALVEIHVEPSDWDDGGDINVSWRGTTPAPAAMAAGTTDIPTPHHPVISPTDKPNLLSGKENTEGINNILVGNDLQAGMHDVIAIGTVTDAISGANKVAGVGSGSIVVGKMKASFDKDVLSIGNENLVVGRGLAYGSGVQIDKADGIGVGNATVVKNINAVALGFGSAVADYSSTPVSKAKFSGVENNDVLNGPLSIGGYIWSADTVNANGLKSNILSRRILNVAGGVNDTDAVNVKQLTTVNDNINKTIATGYTGYDGADTYKAPDFNVAGATYHTVKEAVEAAAAPWTLKTISDGATTAGYAVGPESTVTLVAGNNVTLAQAGGTVTINANGSALKYFKAKSTLNDAEALGDDSIRPAPKPPTSNWEARPSPSSNSRPEAPAA